MARLVRVTPAFVSRLRACGVVAGSPLAREVGAVVRELARASELPRADDAESMIPPTRVAFVRRVPGRNLWLWWRADEDELVMLLVTTSPPVPVA
jgi:hypothetical protein